MADTTGQHQAGSEAAVLRIDDLRFGYEPGEAVIEGFSAQLAPGRVCTLIGPNAAGKSTLLRLLLGHVKPWSGHVRIGGQEAWSMAASQRAKWVSFVPQRSGASFAFGVEQVVAMGRYALAAQPEAIEQAMAACDLGALRHRVYTELSAGQQQRVLLARAMAQAQGGGRLMLLDEPISAMDLRHIHRTMRLMTDLARQGLAVLVVLHDLNLAARYADEVWLMQGGRLAASGRWDQVLRPEILEPVYRVRLEQQFSPGRERPVFSAELADTLESGGRPG